MKTSNLHISTKRRFLLAACIALMALALSVPLNAKAAASDWSETTGGRMRVVVLPPDGDGHVKAILEIAPDDGWHTYWRAPGNGGIPPKIRVDGSSNLVLSAVNYPTPEVISYGNLSDYGYTSTVRFPLELQQVTKGAPSTLKLNAFVGVCAEICVPFQADFEVMLPGDGKAAANEAALVNAASALLPETPGADFSVVDQTLSADERALTATIRLPAGANTKNTKFLAYIGAQAFKPGLVIGEHDGTATVALEPYFLAKDTTLSGQTIGILVNTGMRAMETQITLP